MERGAAVKDTARSWGIWDRMKQEIQPVAFSSEAAAKATASAGSWAERYVAVRVVVSMAETISCKTEKPER